MDLIALFDVIIVRDRRYSKHLNSLNSFKNSLKIIKDFSENLDLLDAWRVLNPDE